MSSWLRLGTRDIWVEWFLQKIGGKLAKRLFVQPAKFLCRNDFLCKAQLLIFQRLEGRRKLRNGLFQLKSADGVFADAAEVEGAVMFDDVGDLGVAVGWAVLKVFDDFAL
jgi:hypothetical protein